MTKPRGVAYRLRMTKLKTLTTAEEVIEEIGIEPLRILTGRTDKRVCHNWRHRGFPPDTFLAVTLELEKRGFKADPAVFQQSGKVHADA